ncbi:hypothetical protein BHE74_00038266 [Ensete ventricosum]|nr:hypothetical protein BHE74_00038266 [Ensete ventricosum]
MSIRRMWDPVAYALGFIDCDNISARCMLTIFALFATKTEASLLRMLKGSPDVYLSGPIRKFHLRWGCREILYEKSSDGNTYVTGITISKLLTFLSYFECGRLQNGKLCRLMLTLQLRYNGWVTELQDLEISRQLTGAVGLDNLLYTPDADFSCFADLALTSPEDYYIEGQGSLIQ